MPDPLAPLARVVAKYKRDVHHLPPAAAADAITSLEGHLQRPLPAGLRDFLAQHNGAQLFRGALRVRSTSEIALASEKATQVVLFADGQGDARGDATRSSSGLAGQAGEVRWAWAADGAGGHVFGPWTGEGLDARHASFGGWLASAIALLDTRVTRPEDLEALALEADPDDPYQLLLAGERALRAGQPEEAERLLRRATTLAPTHAFAWQRLGDALSATDRTAARMAWLQALRVTKLPLPWPGAPCPDPEVLRPLASAFPGPEEWEREIERFLTDQVRDVTGPREAELVVAAATELARSRRQRGKRTLARDALSDLLARCRRFTLAETPWDALLELARLEIDLGHHDEAEALLRRLRREGPKEAQGAGHLALARIAVARQEPWAEEILDEAVAAGLDELDTVEAAALRVERAVRQDRLDEARTWLERVAAVARRVAVRPLHALAALADADVHRAAGDLAKAREAVKKGLSLVGEKDDPELSLRLVLRAGDIALAEDRREEAARHYVAAVEGFAAHELPVREGWALVRLARLSRSPEPLLAAARDKFSQADLAAGIAAIDAMRGEPGASLPWHLDRAAAQARARFDAQRSRPPWERADAERPERRLGAHRLAIAACAEPVVTTISAVMDEQARAIGAGRGRALDPPVMKYIAAVDLLSAHRSYSAARLMLEHLLRGQVEGTAWRALQGAIARSPNAALIDGLLSVVESAAQHPGDSVAAAAEVLGLRREKEAVRALVGLVAPKSNPIARKAAIAALGRIGDRSVVDRLLPSLDEPGLAEAAALALLMLGDRRGVDFHGRALAEGRRDLSGSPGEIVGRYGGPSHLLLLVNASDGTDERALGALQGLGLMGDPRAVPALLRALQNRDRKTAEVAAGALQILTGHAEDIEETGARGRFQVWWEQNGPRFKDGVRHRDGRVYDIGLLLQKMDHDDPWVRRTAYDELVITSGCALPFDVDGPWRVQRAHLRAWMAWAKKDGARLLPGRWYLDGAQVS